MTTFTFNTGREYSPDGQIIEVVLINSKVSKFDHHDLFHIIHFNDTTRGITGELSLFDYDQELIKEGFKEGSAFEKAILRQYDHGYKDISASNFGK